MSTIKVRTNLLCGITIRELEKQSDARRALDRFHHCLKLLGVYFSSWIDNRNFALCGSPAREMTFIGISFRGWAISKPVEGRKYNLRDLLHSQSNWHPQKDISQNMAVFSMKYLCYRNIFGFKLQRCIFSSFHSRSKSKWLEHWLNLRRADTFINSTFHSSAFSHLTAGGAFTENSVRTASVQFKRTIVLITRTHLGQLFLHLCATTASLAFCNDTATVSQCVFFYQGKTSSQTLNGMLKILHLMYNFSLL